METLLIVLAVSLGLLAFIGLVLLAGLVLLR